MSQRPMYNIPLERGTKMRKNEHKTNSPSYSVMTILVIGQSGSSIFLNADISKNIDDIATIGTPKETRDVTL